jgi:hypothetical protein
MRLNRPDTATRMQLLCELCLDLGFCLPPSEQTRLAVERPSSADELTDAIFAAEGLDPTLANRTLWKKVRDRVPTYFGDGNDDLEAAHTCSANHRQQIEASNLCGCFYCVKVFAPTEIQEWVDDGATALCPKFGVDSVIGSHSVAPITHEFLMRLREVSFGSSAGCGKCESVPYASCSAVAYGSILLTTDGAR